MARRQIHTLKYTAKEIDDILQRADDKPFFMWLDEESGVYRIFAKESDYDLWKSDRVTYRDLELYNFIAPAPYKIEVILKDESAANSYVLKGEVGNRLEFTTKTYDHSDGEVVEGVTVTYTFNNQGNTRSRTVTYPANTNISYPIDDFLGVGVNNITITVTGNNSKATAYRTLIYTVVDLYMTTTFNIAKAYVPSSRADFDISVNGLPGVDIEMYIDGVRTYYDKMSTSTIPSKTVGVDIPSSPGKHTLQAQLKYILENGSVFKSRLLYYEFMVTGDVSGVCISYIFPPTQELIDANRSNLIIPTEKYNVSNIQWSYYSTRFETTNISWTAGEDTIANTSAITSSPVGSIPYTLSLMPVNDTEGPLRAYSSNVVEPLAVYNIIVKENTQGIQETLNGLTLRLLPLGKSNTSPDRDVWEYNGITTTFNGFEWSEAQGWSNGKLCISGGASIDIDFAPFANVSNGCTFEIDFLVRDVRDSDALIMSVGNSNTMNMRLKADMMSFGRGDRVISSQFPQGIRIKMALILYPPSSPTDSRLMYIVNNGIMERVIQYSGDVAMNSGDKITIGGTSDASIEIYGIRAYNRGITMDDEFYNYIIDSGNAVEKVIENDIYADDGMSVSVEKMKGILPVMLVTGDVQTLLNSVSKSTEVYMPIVEFYNCDNPRKNFTINNARMKLQGTSSLTYPRKNFKLYSAKNPEGGKCVMYDHENNVIPNGLYAFYDGDVPVDTWTLKADFSDSSCTHNSTIARMYGDIEPSSGLFTPPQSAANSYSYTKDGVTHGFPYTRDGKTCLRTTPNSQPMVMFWRPTESDEYIFMGQYNMLNDKGNEYVFGFHSIYDNEDDPFLFKMSKSERKQWKVDNPDKILWDNKDTFCFEILNNNAEGFGDYSLFKSNTGFFDVYADGGDMKCNWEQSFEARYPEIDDDASIDDRKATGKPMYYFIEWTKSMLREDGTIDSQAFAREAQQHLDIDFCLSYYTYLIRFGAVDQVQKNMMWTTYGELSVPEDQVEDLLPDHLKALKGVDDQEYNFAKKYYFLKWFPIRYDNDTILGLNNQGQLAHNWDVDRQTMDALGYAYAGHDSIIWNAIEDCVYNGTAGQGFNFNLRLKEIDNRLYSGGINYDNVCRYFDTTASDRWCERIYNANERYKYIDPLFLSGRNYLSYMQGKRQLHRRWWIGNRFDLYDAMWSSGNYGNNNISIKLKSRSGEEGDNGGVISITSFMPYYYGYTVNKNSIFECIHVGEGITSSGSDGTVNGASYESRDGVLTIVTSPGTIQNDPQYIYGTNQAEIVDFSGVSNRLYDQFTISVPSGTNVDCKIRKLIIGNTTGDESKDNMIHNDPQYLAVSNINMAPALEYIDITGIRRISIDNNDIRSLRNLSTFKAKRTNITSFTPATGVKMSLIELPSTITEIVMDSASWDVMDYEDRSSLNGLTFTNMGKNLKVKSMIEEWLSAMPIDSTIRNKRIICTDIDWEYKYSDINTIKMIARKVSEMSADSVLQGRIVIDPQDGNINTIINDIRSSFGAGAFDETAVLRFVIKDYLVFDGNISATEGRSIDLLDHIIDYSGGSKEYHFELLTPSVDDIVIDGHMLYTSITGSNRSAVVSVRCDGITNTTNLNILARVYPQNILIESDIDGINVVGEPLEDSYLFTARFGGEMTGDVIGCQWSIVGDMDEYVTIESISREGDMFNNQSMILHINNVPPIDTIIPIRASITFDKIVDDHLLSVGGEKDIMFYTYTYPSSCTISGRTVLSTTGEYIYTPIVGEAYSGNTAISWNVTGDTTDGWVWSTVGDNCVVRVVSNPGSNAVGLNISLTISWEGGSVSASKSARIVYEEPIISSTNNPNLMRMCYDMGWATDRNTMYKDECAAISNEEFNNKFTVSNLNAYNVSNLSILPYMTIEEIPSSWLSSWYTLDPIVLPPSVRTIGSSAFSNIRGDGGIVDISRTSIDTLNPFVFTGASGKTIYLPTTIKHVDTQALISTRVVKVRSWDGDTPTDMNTDTLNLETLGEYSFANNSFISKIRLGGDITFYVDSYGANNAFAGCISVTDSDAGSSDRRYAVDLSGVDRVSINGGSYGTALPSLIHLCASTPGSINSDTRVSVLYPASCDRFIGSPVVNINTTDIYSFRPVPPMADDSAFVFTSGGVEYRMGGAVVGKSKILHVPSGSEDAYTSASGWRKLIEWGYVIEPIQM